MSSRDRTLGEDLRKWLVRQTGEEIAERFYPWIRDGLHEAGYDLGRPTTKERLQKTTEKLRRADITPANMRRAVREAQRANAQNLSVLEWTRRVQERAHSKKLAKGASQQAQAQLQREFGEDAPILDAPPTPKEVFAFFLVWEEFGGTSALAASRELQSIVDGAPPQN